MLRSRVRHCRPQMLRRVGAPGSPSLRSRDARGALDGLSTGAGMVLHFDVDAVDSSDLPLANYPHYGTGVSLDTAAKALAVAAAAPDLTAIVLTEVNPTHDPDGQQLRRYVDAVGGALAAGLVRATPTIEEHWRRFPGSYYGRSGRARSEDRTVAPRG